MKIQTETELVQAVARAIREAAQQGVQPDLSVLIEAVALRLRTSGHGFEVQSSAGSLTVSCALCGGDVISIGLSASTRKGGKPSAQKG